MNEKKNCLRCGGTNLEVGELQSTGKIYSRPKNASIKTILTTGVLIRSIMCLDCGHVELVADPNKLRQSIGTAS